LFLSCAVNGLGALLRQHSGGVEGRRRAGRRSSPAHVGSALTAPPARVQAHDDMDALRCNLRQEHWEVLNWVTKCFEILSPVQAARFMLGSHPRWCVAAAHVLDARGQGAGLSSQSRAFVFTLARPSCHMLGHVFGVASGQSTLLTVRAECLQTSQERGVTA